MFISVTNTLRIVRYVGSYGASGKALACGDLIILGPTENKRITKSKSTQMRNMLLPKSKEGYLGIILILWL